MLRDTDLRNFDRDDFEQITKGLRLGIGSQVRRLGWVIAGFGVAVQVVGVIAATYDKDASQPGGGPGSFSAVHIGHFLLLLGVGVAAMGALLALLGPWLYGRYDRPVGLRLTQLVAPPIAIALVVAGVVTMQRVVLRTKATITVATLPNLAPGTTSAAGPVSTNPDVAAAASIPDQPLDPATRAKLAAQLTLARQVALSLPTVADAERAGMFLAGGFAPGSGAHYIWYAGISKGILPDGEVDPRYPGSFIYDGTSPTSRIVGLMYLSLSDGPAPQGFAGPNDHWHRHFNLCVRYGATGIQVPFPADADVTRAQCDAVHGQFMRQTVWMVHTWVVPGWESPQGVFSHANTDLRCADGTYDTDPQGFCKGT